MKLKKSLRNLKKNLGNSIDRLYDRLDESAKIIEAQAKKIDQCYEKIETLESENVLLKTKLSEVQVHYDDLEQRMLSNNVEIHGVPFTNGENLTGVVGKIGAELGLELGESNIDYCYRLKPKENGEPGSIHVRFNSQHVKEAFLAKRRLKRNFSTRHLILDNIPPSDVPIYINESLCPGRRRVLGAAREAKKTKRYTYLWIRGGKIFMRKAEGERAIVLTTMEDLSKL